MVRNSVKMVCYVFAFVCSLGTVRGDEAELGRVFGMYALHATKSPAPSFPFHSLTQVNPAAVATSANAATPSTSYLSAEDVASLPTNAFEYTGYVDPSTSDAYVFVISNLTPHAEYTLDVYLNEPWLKNTRSQKFCINGENVKDEGGNDLVVKPEDLVGGAAKSIGKLTFSNVTAQVSGTISFSCPSVGDQSVLNVLTVAGTNLPTAATSLVYTPGGEGGMSGTLTWTTGNDTLGFYVERRVGETGVWETCSHSVLPQGEITVDGQDTTYFRVVSSNGLGVATSGLTSIEPRRRLRYALNLGERTTDLDWFVPADTRILKSSYHVRPTFAGTLGVVPDAYKKVTNMYRTYGYLLNQEDVKDNSNESAEFVFSNLVAEAVYLIRLHVVEPFSGAEMDESRKLNILTNGAVAVASWNERTAISNANNGTLYGGVAYVDVRAAADADGVLTYTVKKDGTIGIAGQTVVLCGVELFARDDEPMSSDIPPLGVVEFTEGVRVVPEYRHAQFTYEIEYKDAEDGTSVQLASAATVQGVFDRSVAVGSTRWYRARATFLGEQGGWSAWVAGTRQGRSLFAPLRVNFTQLFTDLTPAGWVNSAGYAVDGTTTFQQTPSTVDAYTVPQGAVSGQAPDIIYQTGILFKPDESPRPVCRFRFPGFDPAQRYRMRLHLLENFYDAKDARLFAASANRACYGNTVKVDAWVVAGGMFRPGVVDCEVMPTADGSIYFEVLKRQQNPALRGLEFIPEGTDGTFGSGRMAIWQNASDQGAENALESFVAEQDLTAFSWSADDLPEGIAGSPRILAHAQVYVPTSDDYQFTATADGTLNLWVDGQAVVVGVNTFLTCGIHDLLVEHLSTSASACTATLDWSATHGVSSLNNSLVSDNTPVAYPADWHFIQIGAAKAPAFIRRSSTEGSDLLMGASGNDMWGGTDCATFLYRSAGKEAFDCSLLVTGIDCPQMAAATRFGISVRSSLVPAETNAFALYMGMSGLGDIRGYADTDPTNGKLSLNTWFPAFTSPSFTAPPFVLRAVRERLGANDRYILSCEAVNGTWSFAQTQEVARTENVYVGPLSISQYTAGTALTQYAFRDLTYVETTKKGTMVLVR